MRRGGGQVKSSMSMLDFARPSASHSLCASPQFGLEELVLVLLWGVSGSWLLLLLRLALALLVIVLVPSLVPAFVGQTSLLFPEPRQSS